jgi:hypothetical protein
VSSSQPRGATRHPSPLAPGASFSDFQEARERFLETLRRDSQLRRLEAAGGFRPRTGATRPAGAASAGDGLRTCFTMT